MKFEMDGYEIVSKIFLGNDLKLIFKKLNDDKNLKVLELNGLVGFLENNKINKKIKILSLDYDGGGSYNFDLAIRLQNKEIQNYSTAFIFLDEDTSIVYLSAVAKSIKFRDWNIKDKWL